MIFQRLPGSFRVSTPRENRFSCIYGKDRDSLKKRKGRQGACPAGNMMIRREDMLELTRRMTPSRACIGQIAGAYLDEEGYVDGTFNKNFLRLSAAERNRNLGLAKEILISRTNEQLKEYRIPEEARRAGSVWQLLDGIRESGLKNDALLDIFYEVLGEKYHPGYPYSCFFFHGRYDVPVKGTDGEWLEGSEEVYEYMICMRSPRSGEYEPGRPEFGFLYPAFRNRYGEREYMNLFESRPEREHGSLKEWLLNG